MVRCRLCEKAIATPIGPVEDGRVCAWQGAFSENRNCATLLTLWGALQECAAHSHPRVKFGSTRAAEGGGTQAVALICDLGGLRLTEATSANFLVVQREFGEQSGKDAGSSQVSALMWGMNSVQAPTEEECMAVVSYLIRERLA